MKHVGTKTIETTRLTLRRLELTDAEMMFSNGQVIIKSRVFYGGMHIKQ